MSGGRVIPNIFTAVCYWVISAIHDDPLIRVMALILGGYHTILSCHLLSQYITYRLAIGIVKRRVLEEEVEVWRRLMGLQGTITKGDREKR